MVGVSVLLLLDQLVIYAGNSLLAGLSGCGIGKNTALKPFVVRILAGLANITELG